MSWHRRLIGELVVDCEGVIMEIDVKDVIVDDWMTRATCQVNFAQSSIVRTTSMRSTFNDQLAVGHRHMPTLPRYVLTPH